MADSSALLTSRASSESSARRLEQANTGVADGSMPTPCEIPALSSRRLDAQQRIQILPPPLTMRTKMEGKKSLTIERSQTEPAATQAAKYLDYLDSSQNTNQANSNTSGSNTTRLLLNHHPHNTNNNQHQCPTQTLQPNESTQGQQIIRKTSKSARRPRAIKKNDMLAMSLPSSASLEQRGLPISGSFRGSKTPPTNLSCSFTPGSPQSSPTSIVLLSSKTSGVTSNISSASSSLSSSDSSSSCGEILMSELDSNQYATSVGSNCSLPNTGTSSKSNKQRTKHQAQHQQTSHMNANIELLTNIQQLNNNNQLTHPFNDANTTYHRGAQTGSMPRPITGGTDKRFVSRRKTSKSAGPKMMTLTPNQSIASTSVPLDGNLHAGRVLMDGCPGQLKFASPPSAHQLHNRTSGSALDIHGSSSYMSISNTYFSPVCGGSLINQASPPPSGSLIMARVQPMILNSLAPSAHQSIMAFQQATAPSPTSTSSSYSRHRELHKTLEKNRRAHLRHCFELLKAELPGSECVDRKTSHINIIKSAIRCVLSLIEQEAKLESELQRQMEIKSQLTNQLANYKDNLLTNQQPVAEQQLSFLLSRSKID